MKGDTLRGPRSRSTCAGSRWSTCRDARADDDPDAVGVLLGHVELGIDDGLLAAQKPKCV